MLLIVAPAGGAGAGAGGAAGVLVVLVGAGAADDELVAEPEGAEFEPLAMAGVVATAAEGREDPPPHPTTAIVKVIQMPMFRTEKGTERISRF